ncbi:RNA polymerase sigma factor [Dyadobacter psychrotolerans]|uniref:RNA polymerase sigma factor n=1 Tax=Dyadobacter psychrotolerans TaxID=2541721 RepID=A0A4V2Z2X0_9BACT|nr:RNA polymerase sigma factor [Dyadobacter psychrotolerans]TDE10478.1 RNA polymerase sigma factor [Dyadobacter psychrotolerans]
MFSFSNKPTYNLNDFESVIAGCIAGDSQSQRYLFKKYFGYCKSICLRYTSSTEEAEEVLNEGFLKVFNNLKTYVSTFPFKGWIRTIMINTAISYYRKHKKHSENRMALDDAPYIKMEDDVISQITADEILELIQQLKPHYKTVFLLHVVDGYNHREIAEMLQINEATIRSHYVRARVRLQQLIRENYPYLISNEYALTA